MCSLHSLVILILLNFFLSSFVPVVALGQDSLYGKEKSQINLDSLKEKIDLLEKLLDGKVKVLEQRQDVVLDSVSRSFTNSVILLGLFGTIITILSFVQYRRDERILRGQEKQIEDA